MQCRLQTPSQFVPTILVYLVDLKYGPEKGRLQKVGSYLFKKRRTSLASSLYLCRHLWNLSQFSVALQCLRDQVDNVFIDFAELHNELKSVLKTVQAKFQPSETISTDQKTDLTGLDNYYVIGSNS